MFVFFRRLFLRKKFPERQRRFGFQTFSLLPNYAKQELKDMDAWLLRGACKNLRRNSQLHIYQAETWWCVFDGLLPICLRASNRIPKSIILSLGSGLKGASPFLSREN